MVTAEPLYLNINKIPDVDDIHGLVDDKHGLFVGSVLLGYITEFDSYLDTMSNAETKKLNYILTYNSKFVIEIKKDNLLLTKYQTESDLLYKILLLDQPVNLEFDMTCEKIANIVFEFQMVS